MPKFELKQPLSEPKKQNKNEVSEENFHPSQEDLEVLIEEGQRPATEKFFSPEENARRMKALREKLERKEQQPSLFKKEF
ncbi:hypothetical protein KJ590_02865 [Patescibacteria group bacterium]|nr:hypothetical protein [Patescibacteria group bacterium]